MVGDQALPGPWQTVCCRPPMSSATGISATGPADGRWLVRERGEVATGPKLRTHWGMCIGACIGSQDP
jgi:hypothetical protein